ncbi:MAG: riboflavin synthase [Chloroflexi bacterium]|nr:riboflavin synthase [Chloroflexota bacterium]
MFTGIVEEVGTVVALRGQRLTIAARKALEGMAVGDSIAVDGACLTIVARDATSFSVDLSPETLARTTLAALQPGGGVNLERALTPQSRLGGHFVQGHVDGTGRILSIATQEGAHLFRIGASSEIMRYLVEKGFIAVDGISLTVAALDVSSFAVSVIPYTYENTTLGHKDPGAAVNLEVDILAKYVEKLHGGTLRQAQDSVTMELLERHGFLGGR